MPWQNYGQTQSDVVVIVVVNDVVRLCLGRCRKSSAVCATPSRRGCSSCLPHMKMVFIKEKTTQQAKLAGRQREGKQVAMLCLLSAINNKLMAVKNKQAHSKAIKSECIHFAHNKKIEYF